MFSRSRWESVGAVVSVLAGVTVALAGYYLFPQPTQAVSSNWMHSGPEDFDPVAAAWPGLLQPELDPAGGRYLSPDQEVIGIAVGDRYRAYLIEPFQDPSQSIVNDLIDGVPLSITYSEMEDVVRVLHDPKRHTPIELASFEPLTEIMSFGLVLDGQGYRQNSWEIPLTDYPFVRTSWREWKEMHPETEVYVGPDRDYD